MVPYTLTGIQPSDITSGTLTGNFVVGSVDSVTVTMVNDNIVEGGEHITLTLDNVIPVVFKKVFITDAVSIDYDLKFVDCVTNNLISSATYCNDGQLCFNLNTTGIAPGTSIDFTLTGLPEFDITFEEDNGTQQTGTFCNFRNMNVKLNAQNFAPGSEVEFTVTGLPPGP